MIQHDDPRRLIARLAVAIVAADGQVSPAELVAVTELDLLGLGRLSPLVEEELLAAVEQPIDVPATCEGLARLGPQASAIILTILARVAASDGTVSPRESETFALIADGLGVPPPEAGHVLDAAIVAQHARRGEDAAPAAGEAAAPPAPPPTDGSSPSRACHLLGVEQGASPERLDAAYMAAVARYDPARMLPLGPDFVRLSVRKLAEITEAFETLRAAA